MNFKIWAYLAMDTDLWPLTWPHHHHHHHHHHLVYCSDAYQISWTKKIRHGAKAHNALKLQHHVYTEINQRANQKLNNNSDRRHGASHRAAHESPLPATKWPTSDTSHAQIHTWVYVILPALSKNFWNTRATARPSAPRRPVPCTKVRYCCDCERAVNEGPRMRVIEVIISVLRFAYFEHEKTKCWGLSSGCPQSHCGEGHLRMLYKWEFK